MDGVEASGRSIDEAVENALEELGATRDQVRVEVLNPGRGGVFGLGIVEAQVRVRLLAEGEAPADEPEDEAAPPPASASEQTEGDGPVEDAAEKAAQILDKLLALMGIEAEVSIRDPETPGEGLGLAEAVLDVEGDDLGVLIGRRGETLQSLQFILNLMASRLLGERIQFTVDVEGYRSRREGQLRNMAQRMADQVRRTRQSVTLELMPPSERRIVHITLAEDRHVTTESIGEGDERQVSINPR